MKEMTFCFLTYGLSTSLRNSSSSCVQTALCEMMRWMSLKNDSSVCASSPSGSMMSSQREA